METASTSERVKAYVAQWRSRGYDGDIPDDAPTELTSRNLAPSYRAVAEAILKNDLRLESLGGSPPKPSPWYGVLKRIEIEDRMQQQEAIKGIKPVKCVERIKQLYCEDGLTWDDIATALESEEIRTTRGIKFTGKIARDYYYRYVSKPKKNADTKKEKKPRVIKSDTLPAKAIKAESVYEDLIKKLTAENAFLMHRVMTYHETIIGLEMTVARLNEAN